MTTLRSLMIGDCDHYQSPYMLGVAQACPRLGIEHRQVSIRSPIRSIERAIEQHKPNLIWTHMILWAPEGSPSVGDLVALMERAARNGARIILHDGDYKERCRYPRDISSWCSLALLNHEFDRSPWKVPTLKWPYFAMAQVEIARPDPRWACGLFFAGTIGQGPVYEERTAFLKRLQTLGVGLRMPSSKDGNTLMQTPVIAASADAVLGFGRPGVKGWVDTRVTQYPGAGAILLHDDPGGLLEPWTHYVPYQSGRAESVAEALRQIRALSAAERMGLRERAFAFVQERHSSVARVKQVLAELEMNHAM